MDQILITAMPPEGTCVICMKHEQEVGELVIHQVVYPHFYSQKRICSACREKVATAIAKMLEEIGWQ